MVNTLWYTLINEFLHFGHLLTLTYIWINLYHAWNLLQNNPVCLGNKGEGKAVFIGETSLAMSW